MHKMWSKVNVIVGCLLFIAICNDNSYSFSPDEPPKAKVETSKKPLYLPNRDQNKDIQEWMVTAAKIHKEMNKSVSKTPLSLDVFIQGYLGYMNLKSSHLLNPQKYILTITDYSLSANVPRLWVIDLKQNKILYNTLVSHGQGSGEEYAVKFSNTENSHQTSLGFFITDTTYMGKNGYSLRLHGLDKGYNDRALERAIVIHGAPYVSEKFISENERLGRSWGCPALPEKLNAQIIDIIKGGSVFFGYYPDHKYLTSSIWLNKVPQNTIQKTAHEDNRIMHAQHTDSTLINISAPTQSL